jgi:predicted phage-related endonuclease
MPINCYCKMIVYDYPQGSLEWLKIRRGLITGSKAKGVYKADNLPLIDELIAEMTTELDPDDYFQSRDMEWGEQHESEAAYEYEKVTYEKTWVYGFCVSKEYPYLGYSPDRIVLKDGKPYWGLEIKCPKSKTHIKYIRMDVVPSEHMPQIIHFFIVCPEIQFVEFISYDPRNKIEPLFRKTITRIEAQKQISTCLELLKKFKIKLDKYLLKICKNPP